MLDKGAIMAIQYPVVRELIRQPDPTDTKKWFWSRFFDGIESDESEEQAYRELGMTPRPFVSERLARTHFGSVL